MRLTLALRAPVLIALAAGLALRLYLIFATPIGTPGVPGRLSSYNDEIAHVNYILHVAQTGQLPPSVGSIQGENALREGYFENYQPPFYYVIAASIGRMTGLNSAFELTLLGRFLNLALFALLFPLMLAIGRELKLELPHIHGVLIFLALNGVAVRFSSTATNDILFWLFAGGMIWSALLLFRKGLTARKITFFAAFAAAALYTKLTAMLLLPLAGLMLFQNYDKRQVLGLFLMYMGVFLATLPVWMRNINEFGALFPLSAGFGAPDYAMPPPELLTYAVRSFVFPWSEFWYGWIGLLFMLPVLVLMASSLMRKTTWRFVIRQPVAIAALAITTVAFIWLNIQYRQAEARYLFSAWPLLAILLSRPLRDNSAAGCWLFAASLVLPYTLFVLPALGI